MTSMVLNDVECNAAITALGGFLDNEHDKGADESPMCDSAVGMLDRLAKGAGTHAFTLLDLATLDYACQSQGGPEGSLDMDDMDEEYVAACTAMCQVSNRIIAWFERSPA